MSANNSILVCGLGPSPERDATLEALQLLSACRIVYADPGTFGWLQGRVKNLQRAAKAAEILKAALRAGPVGVAVQGHPCQTSRLAADLSEICIAKGVSCRIVASISPISSYLAVTGQCLGWGKDELKGVRADSAKPGRPVPIRADE